MFFLIHGRHPQTACITAVALPACYLPILSLQAAEAVGISNRAIAPQPPKNPQCRPSPFPASAPNAPHTIQTPSQAKLLKYPNDLLQSVAGGDQAGLEIVPVLT